MKINIKTPYFFLYCELLCCSVGMNIDNHQRVVKKKKKLNFIITYIFSQNIKFIYYILT